MPALHATLTARDLFPTTTNTSVTPKAILLIVFVAIVPVLLVSGLVSWLLCCYGRDRKSSRKRNLTEMKEKENPTSAPQIPQKDVEIAAFLRPSPSPHNPYSGETQMVPTVPEKALRRNDTVGSERSGRSVGEKGEAMPRGFV